MFEDALAEPDGAHSADWLVEQYQKKLFARR